MSGYLHYDPLRRLAQLTGSPISDRTFVYGNIRRFRPLEHRCRQGSEAMAEHREKISTGPNESPVNATIASTGPGIPDDPLGPGEELPEPPTDTQVEQARRDLSDEKKPESRRFDEDPLPVEGQ